MTENFDASTSFSIEIDAGDYYERANLGRNFFANLNSLVLKSMDKAVKRLKDVYVDALFEMVQVIYANALANYNYFTTSLTDVESIEPRQKITELVYQYDNYHYNPQGSLDINKAFDRIRKDLKVVSSSVEYELEQRDYGRKERKYKFNIYIKIKFKLSGILYRLEVGENSWRNADPKKVSYFVLHVLRSLGLNDFERERILNELNIKFDEKGNLISSPNFQSKPRPYFSNALAVLLAQYIFGARRREVYWLRDLFVETIRRALSNNRILLDFNFNVKKVVGV